MAGFFGFFDYTKEGPGVSKDEPPKHWFIVFMDIVSRKFWKLVRLNMLYFLFSLPALIAIFFLSAMYYRPSGEMDVEMIYARFVVGLIFVCIPVVTVGPATAGFTYVLRNFAREEHAWIWSDFIEHGMKNFKQGIIISLIDLVISFVMLFNLNAYGLLQNQNFAISLMRYLFLAIVFLYVMMHLYIYPILVTFKLSIKQIFKNAFIFTMVKLFPNILVTLLCMGLVLASFYFNMIIGALLFTLITMSFIGLIINFYVYPTMKKYMMRDDEDEEEENDDAVEGTDIK